MKSIDALQKKYDEARDELVAACEARLEKIQRMGDTGPVPVLKRKRGRPPERKNKTRR
jgi:hypothetical protein